MMAGRKGANEPEGVAKPAGARAIRGGRVACVLAAMIEVLRIGTVNSPCHGTPLHWEQFGGMRVFFQRGAFELYRAKCATCGRQHEVRRTHVKAKR